MIQLKSEMALMNTTVDQMDEKLLMAIKAISRSDLSVPISSANTSTSTAAFKMGDLVFLHTFAWNELPAIFKQLRYKFKDSLYNFVFCVGYILKCENELIARVRFFTRQTDGATVTNDFVVPCSVLQRPNQHLRFQSNDLLVFVDLESETQKVMIVRDTKANGQILVLESMNDSSTIEVNGKQYILVPVYNSQNQSLIEKMDAGDAQEVDNDRFMRRLLINEKPQKVTYDYAIQVLKNTLETRDDRYLREACALVPNFVNSMIGDSIALVEAIKLESPYLVSLLLACGANPNVRDRRGNSLLHIAVELGCFDVIRALELNMPDALNTPNLMANTPFHVACKAKNRDLIVKLLNISKIDPTYRNGDGYTGLHELIRMPENDEQRARCIEAFVHTNKAIRTRVLNATTQLGLTPLMAAIYWKKDEAFRILLRKCPPGDSMIGTEDMEVSLVQALARSGNYRLFKQIVDKCNGNYLETSTGRTVLHFAVDGWNGTKADDYNRCRIIEFLCCAGDYQILNKADAFGNTPIHQLALYVNELDQKSPFDILIFPPIIAAKMSNLADMLAASNMNYPLATLCFLSACGADFQRKNADEKSPLDLIKRVEVRVLLSDCAKYGVNEWLETGLPKAASKIKKRTCYNCRTEMEVRNVVYCLPCQHYFACAECRHQLKPISQCLICTESIRSIRVIIDGNDEVLFRDDMTVQYASDGRLVSEVIEEMKGQISALEDHVLCGICMEEKTKVAFGCGHTACDECARQMRKKTNSCHVCRQTIVNSITIY
ncbi:Ankyrin repeat protein [Aphelenchoides besseyi]|nr:Ankyrin repeat protein [Aphelenchoides besseyi]